MDQLDQVTMTDWPGGAADNQLLSDTQTVRQTDSISQHASGQLGDSPVGIFDDPPVVDIFEGVAGDLLLVGTAPPILIPGHTHRKQEVTFSWSGPPENSAIGHPESHLIG